MSFGSFSPIPRKPGQPGQENKPLGVIPQQAGVPGPHAPGPENRPLGVVPQTAAAPGPAAPVPQAENRPLGVIPQTAAAPGPAAPGPQAAGPENKPHGVMQQPVAAPQPASPPPQSQPQPVNPFTQQAPHPQTVPQPVNPFAQPASPPVVVQAVPVSPVLQSAPRTLVHAPPVNPFLHPGPQMVRLGEVTVPSVDPYRAPYGPPPIPLPPTGPPDPDVIAIVGRFGPWPWQQFPDEAYLADALEALGKRVVRIDQDHPQALLPPALWVVCTAYPSSMEKIERWAGERRTILWTLDWLLHDEKRQPAIDEARTATLFASSDEWDWTSSHGIRRHFYLPGACEGIPTRFEPRPFRKCAFMGSLYSARRKRIAEIVRAMGGEVLDHPGAWRYGDALARFVQETKVIVGDNSRNDVRGYWSSRNYIIPGAGGFLLTPRVPGIEEQFTPGRDLALYGPVEELPERIEWWASHDEERERVRSAGFLHVREQHDWRSRAKILLAAIEKYTLEHPVGTS